MTAHSLDRLAAAAERIAIALETLTEARRDPLAVALADVFAASPFTAAEVMREAARQAKAAASMGLAAPDLPAALQAAGIRSAHALARRLPALGAHQIGREAAGALWCFRTT